MDQQRLYQRPVALSRQQHAGWFVEPPQSFAFARSFSAVPITLGEFARAALDHPIVFAPGDGLLAPVAVMGVTSNLSIAEDGSWIGRKYIPAFIRRYPFVLSNAQEGRAGVFIDEAYPGLNQRGAGEALLQPDGASTPYLDKMIEFLSAFQKQLEQTRAFSRRLAQLSLIEPMNVTIGKASPAKTVFTGFSAVNAKRLRALSAETFTELNTSGGLEPIYAHLLSLQRLGDVTRPRN